MNEEEKKVFDLLIQRHNTMMENNTKLMRHNQNIMDQLLKMIKERTINIE